MCRRARTISLHRRGGDGRRLDGRRSILGFLRDDDVSSWAAALSTAAHTAYHLGAIRQVLREVSG